ncbi:DNA cytosine methyltransferase [Streptomyces sp. MUM 178J]|uniref:DNA cytosine methyltransferase n=1 Tax=Streptomyces sp. MUM 178J TaxID=2791991 RepID=UPI001F032F54|nr:DNA cytosine methyltransferase [Streptomyces sp. MUM 178J]WRQ79584.1 DNA cytosine methyltransferase [Streptomyces sp. MUM 178J]
MIDELWPTIDRVTVAPVLPEEPPAIFDLQDLQEPAAADEGAEVQVHKVAEFFAGIGLARLGLESAGFQVAWANDFDRDKCQMYANHFQVEQDSHLPQDIAEVRASDLPDGISLAWASFPCTDLSLAGGRKGLAGKHSSTFFEFTRILEEIDKDSGELPPVVALENVNGFATSHSGKDIRVAIKTLNSLGYSVDVLTLDARRWVPQSRPRLFLVGCLEPPARQDGSVSAIRPAWLGKVFTDPELRTHRAALDMTKLPALRTAGFSDVAERLPDGDSRWWDEVRTEKFLSSLSEIQALRLKELVSQGELTFRTAYRRTRKGVPTWEIRADDIAGCLRTARGGSSKQAVVQVGRDARVGVRWMTSLEYARLMGAGDYNIQAARDSQVVFGFGDAVCVNAVAWLAENYLKPAVSGHR